MNNLARFWRNLPLSSKQALLASLLVMAVVFALTYLTVQRERASFQQGLESQAELLLETLPLTMRDQLYRLELDELADIARVVSGNENVVMFVVYDKQGAILVDASLDKLTFSQEVDPLGEQLIGFARNDSRQDDVHLDWQQEQLIAGRAITLGNQPIGAVAIGLSTEPLNQKIAALTRQSVLLAVVTLLIGGGLSFWSARQITNPLSELTNVTAQMASGDLSNRVEVQSTDEIGQLGYVFNRMADAIQQRESELREFAEGLERTVAERTAELRAQNDALIAARQQAEAANRVKGAFLAMMSHEIRTPINAILGFAQLMTNDTALSRETREDVDTIIRSSEYLLTIINQVLDLSKIEAGRLTLNEKAFDLYHLLDDLENLFRLRAADKQLQLVFTRAANVPQYIRTDEVKLRQVLINLLNNALKFTNEGGVAVRVRAQDHEPPQELYFEVEDTGPGIASEELDEIFEAFVQTRTGKSAQEGTGLGLPISRKFVEMMNGQMTIESELGRGSTFIFSVSINLAEVSEVKDKTTSRRVIALEPDQPRYRILIVDDQKINRQLLIKMLAPLGFELREARDGQEAVAVWQEWQPHLIWMDKGMPVMDGYEATVRIKTECEKDASCRDPVIIVLSATSFDEDIKLFREAGCHDFLHKPFRTTDVFELMHKHLGVRYVYEERARASDKKDKREDTAEDILSPAALAALPNGLLRDLEQATVRSQFNQIIGIIDRIREHDVNIATALEKLADGFEYDKILEAIRNAERT